METVGIPDDRGGGGGTIGGDPQQGEKSAWRVRSPAAAGLFGAVKKPVGSRLDQVIRRCQNRSAVEGTYIRTITGRGKQNKNRKDKSIIHLYSFYTYTYTYTYRAVCYLVDESDSAGFVCLSFKHLHRNPLSFLHQNNIFSSRASLLVPDAPLLLYVSNYRP